MGLQAIIYKNNELKILNQLKLPHAQEYEDLSTAKDAWHAIKNMQVRGAPAIAIVAILALAVELRNIAADGHLSQIAEEVSLYIQEKLDYLVTSRPTAVNLSDAANKMKEVVEKATEKPGANGDHVKDAFSKVAEQMLEDDVRDNLAIGKNGADYILRRSHELGKGPVSVLTHCNTGSLATAGYGTALGVIRRIHELGSLRRAYCTETRPYNQGSRLTAFELIHDQIPSTLITDSMAASLMQLKGESENLTFVIVGADRIAANGDTANKIGTYALAIAAKHHGIKFAVAAPRSTIDLKTKSGRDIEVEERSAREMTTMSGPVINGESSISKTVQTIGIAAPIDVWNPGFDITSAKLIDAIVTEVAVAQKSEDGSFSLNELFS